MHLSNSINILCSPVIFQDRMLICPRFDPSGQSNLFCVFDGTCGDHASDFAQKNFIKYLLQDQVRSGGWLLYCSRPSPSL